LSHVISIAVIIEQPEGSFRGSKCDQSAKR
jgi:hypothetical protein